MKGILKSQNVWLVIKTTFLIIVSGAIFCAISVSINVYFNVPFAVTTLLGGISFLIPGLAYVHDRNNRVQNLPPHPGGYPETELTLQKIRPDIAATMNNTEEVTSSWMKHAYPLQQITVLVQGTRHTEREAMIRQLEIVTARLRAGDLRGTDHDDDFGYRFEVWEKSDGRSFFTTCAGSE